MTDEMTRIAQLHPPDELDDAHLTHIWASVERQIDAAASVPRTVIEPRRRRMLTLGGGIALAGGLAVALLAALAVLPQGGDSTHGGPTGGLARLTPAPASAAEVVRRARRALADQPAAVVYSIEHSPIVGQPGKVSVLERWEDSDDPWTELNRDTEDGKLTLVSFQRHDSGDRLLRYRYMPQRGIYTRRVSDTHDIVGEKGMPVTTSEVVTPPSVLEALRSQLHARGTRLAGHATIEGRDALVVADSEPGMHRVTYVDPDTYLPIRMVERPDGVGEVTIDYRYLDASHRDVFDWAPPASARQVDQLPGD